MRLREYGTMEKVTEFFEFIVMKLVTVLGPFMEKDVKLKEACDIVHNNIIFLYGYLVIIWKNLYMFWCH